MSADEIKKEQRPLSFYEAYLQTYADNLSFTENVSAEEKLLLLVTDIRMIIPLLSRLEAAGRNAEVSAETHAAEAKINARITKMHNDILRDWIQNQDMAGLSEHSSEVPEGKEDVANDPPQTPLKVQQIPWTLDGDGVDSHTEQDQNIIEDSDTDSDEETELVTVENSIILTESQDLDDNETQVSGQSYTGPYAGETIRDMIWNGDM